MRPELKQLRTIASRMGCCAVHMTKLVRPLCHYRWAGTDAEFEELAPLAERVSQYVDEIPPHGRCRCGGDTFCRKCYEEAARQIEVPDDLLSPDELERYCELLGRMVPKDRRGPDR
jgi:hypothetical protein